MIELTILVAPLQTLPGWPAAANPTVLQTLGLLVGAPVVIIVIVFLIAKVHTLAAAGRGGASPVTDPVWLGGRDQAAPEAALSAEQERAAIESSSAAGSAPVVEAAAAERPSEVGGASARW